MSAPPRLGLTTLMHHLLHRYEDVYVGHDRLVGLCYLADWKHALETGRPLSEAIYLHGSAGRPWLRSPVGVNGHAEAIDVPGVRILDLTSVEERLWDRREIPAPPALEPQAEAAVAHLFRGLPEHEPVAYMIKPAFHALIADTLPMRSAQAQDGIPLDLARCATEQQRGGVAVNARE